MNPGFEAERPGASARSGNVSRWTEMFMLRVLHLLCVCHLCYVGPGYQMIVGPTLIRWLSSRAAVSQ